MPFKARVIIKGYGFQQLDILRKYKNEDDKNVRSPFLSKVFK